MPSPRFCRTRYSPPASGVSASIRIWAMTGRAGGPTAGPVWNGEAGGAFGRPSASSTALPSAARTLEPTTST